MLPDCKQLTSTVKAPKHRVRLYCGPPTTRLTLPQVNAIDEQGGAELFAAGDLETSGLDRGWESTADGRQKAGAAELGPAADRILIQGWRIFKLKGGRVD